MTDDDDDYLTKEDCLVEIVHGDDDCRFGIHLENFGLMVANDLDEPSMCLAVAQVCSHCFAQGFSHLGCKRFGIIVMHNEPAEEIENGR